MPSREGSCTSYDSDSYGAQQSTQGGPEDGGTHGHSVFSLVLIIAVVAVVGAVALTIAFLLLGFLFHVVGFILKVAIVAAVVALVWRRVTRHRSPDRI